MPHLKIIIPMAGVGSRMSPLTRSRPKALVRLADRRLLDHVLSSFEELEQAYTVDYIFIVGRMGEQIEEHMRVAHPNKRVTYFTQEQPMGQSHAIYLARDAISGPVLITYCDAINRIDFSFLSSRHAQGVASVQQVEDPRTHGVAIIGADKLLTRLIEKPETMEHKAALTGLYYFPEGQQLVNAIETQMRRGLSKNNEYYLADAVNVLLEGGMRMTAEYVSQWLDAGTPAAVLDANSHLLRREAATRRKIQSGQSRMLIDPVYIHESSHVVNSIIGPNVSIGAHCSINGCIIRNSIIDDDSDLSDVALQNSLIGKGCSMRASSLQSVLADHAVIRIASTMEEASGLSELRDS